MTEQPALSIFESGKPFTEEAYLSHSRGNSFKDPFLRTRGDLLKRLSGLRLQPEELLMYIIQLSIQREDEWCFLIFAEGHEVEVRDKNVTFMSMAVSGRLIGKSGLEPSATLKGDQKLPSGLSTLFAEYTPQVFPRLSVAAVRDLKDFISANPESLQTLPENLTGMYFPVLLRQQMIGGMIWVRPELSPYKNSDLQHAEEFSKVIAFPLETARLGAHINALTRLSVEPTHPFSRISPHQEPPQGKSVFEDVSADALHRSQNASSLTEVASEESEFLKNVQILVVDDDEDVRVFVTLLLEECGANVFQAENVATAYDILCKQEIHGIVSDIAMPNEDGYVLIKKVKALEIELGKRIPALALTAFARAEDSTQLLKAGFQMHLSKPIDPSELVGIVAWLVGRGE